MKNLDESGFFEKMNAPAMSPEEEALWHRVNILEDSLGQDARNLPAWKELAECFETLNQPSDLRRCYFQLGYRYQAEQDYQTALQYYELAESLFANPHMPILRQKIIVYFSLQRVQEAYALARRVVQIYVADGKHQDAIAFLRMLPSFGILNSVWRRELAHLVPGNEEHTRSLLRSTQQSLLRFTLSSLNAEKLKEFIHESSASYEAKLTGTFDLFNANTERLAPPEAAAHLLNQSPHLLSSTLLSIDAEALKEANASAISGFNILVMGGNEVWQASIIAQVSNFGIHAMEARNAQVAQELLTQELPLMVIAQVDNQMVEWHKLYIAMQADPHLRNIPFICLHQDIDAQDIAGALAIGVTDCWRWPQSPIELEARIQHILHNAYNSRAAIAGQLNEIALPDLLQMLESSRKTGVLTLRNNKQYGAIYFNDGNPVNAQFSRWSGENAFYRLIKWNSGQFRFEPQIFDLDQQLHQSVQDLLLESMRRMDEQTKLIDQLPGPDEILSFNLSATLPPAPQVPRLIDLFNGQRPFYQCLEELDMDIDALELVARFYARGVLIRSNRSAQ